MIKNEKQHRVAKKQINKLQEALELSKNHPCKMSKEIYEAMLAGIESQIDDIQKEVDEYEKIISTKQLPCGTLSDIGEQLIKARIARGYTQAQLAEKIGVKQQQIQKYESDQYQKASIGRIKQVIEALDAVVGTHVELSGTTATILREPSDRDYVVTSVESEVTVNDSSSEMKRFEFDDNSSWILEEAA